MSLLSQRVMRLYIWMVSLVNTVVNYLSIPKKTLLKFTIFTNKRKEVLMIIVSLLVSSLQICKDILNGMDWQQMLIVEQKILGVIAIDQ